MCGISAFATLHEPGRDSWPLSVPDRFGPGVAAKCVAPTSTRNAIACGHHEPRSLIVRELLPPNRASSSCATTSAATLRGPDASRDGLAPDADIAPWYEPFALGREKAEGFGNAAFVRAIDSPPTLFDMTEAYGEVGLLRLVEAHLGETRARCRANKCAVALHRAEPVATSRVAASTRRRVPRRRHPRVDVWLALTDCGGDADVPGLDLVPKRVPEVMPTGTRRCDLPVVGVHCVVDDARASCRSCGRCSRPATRCSSTSSLLHCTGLTLGMSQPRYTIECWFFAPSRYPPKHVPTAIVF